MNLVNGMETTTWGFVFAMVLSLAVSVFAWFIFRYKRLI
jgi:magnesium transporter